MPAGAPPASRWRVIVAWNNTIGAALGNIIAAIMATHIATTTKAWPGAQAPQLLMGISIPPISCCIPASANR